MSVGPLVYILSTFIYPAQFISEGGGSILPRNIGKTAYFHLVKNPKSRTEAKSKDIFVTTQMASFASEWKALLLPIYSCHWTFIWLRFPHCAVDQASALRKLLVYFLIIQSVQ
jgi:hypothetical protein